MKSVINNMSLKKGIIIIYFILAVVAGLRQFMVQKYGNYQIFIDANVHLVSGRDVYTQEPEWQHDQFKYSPTFALLFGIFRLLPDVVGLILWDLLNAFLLLFAVYSLPVPDVKRKGYILLFIVIELMTSMQNSQSNGLVAGLLILTFAFLEKRFYVWAAFCIVFSIFIKLFGMVGFILFLFYPGKWKLVLYSLGWSFLFLAAPLTVTSLDQLIFLYHSWYVHLAQDHSISYGLSVMGLLHAWSGVQINKLLVMFSGLVIVLMPFIRVRLYADLTFRIMAFASLLIWVVIFNHKSESPMYIIAMSGIAIWFFTQKMNLFNIILAVIALILISLTTTDLIPPRVRESYFEPYYLKALPAFLIWIKITFELWMRKTLATR